MFEEGGLPEIEFRAIYGAMTIGGIPKPVWRAYQLLHEHAGQQRVATSVSQPTVANSSAMALLETEREMAKRGVSPESISSLAASPST